jgi:ATP synthase protein I
MVRAVPAGPLASEGWPDGAGEDGGASRMTESGPRDPLRRLAEEIDKARSRTDEGDGAGRSDVTSGGGALGFGLRVGIELIAALVVGVALGWLADRYVGTRPWGVILGFLLGSAAGIVNVFRAVQGMGGPPPGRRG